MTENEISKIFQGLDGILQGANSEKMRGALQELRDNVERVFEEHDQIFRVTEKINTGLILDDVLNGVYDSFRSVIPYDRIGFSLLDEDGKVVRARWARAETMITRISKGYAAAIEKTSLGKITETG